MRFSLPAFVSLSLVLLASSFAFGCAAPAEEDTSGSAGAISQDQAVKQFDFAEVVVAGASPSAQVSALGVASWTVYSASKRDFLGLVLVANDAAGQVKYMILANARRAADGKITMVALQLDADGKESNVDAASFKTLAADAARLRTTAQANSHTPDSNAAKCAVALASVTLGAIGGVAVAVVAVPVVEAAAAASALASGLEIVGVSVVGYVPAVAAVWTPVILFVEGTNTALAKCGSST